MKKLTLIAVTAVLLSSWVSGDSTLNESGEHEKKIPGSPIPRGEYPFLALIFFMEEQVQSKGFRLLRTGVLIQPDRVLSSLFPSDVIGDSGFPRKTVLVRMGRVRTDNWAEINTEDGEQEGEVVRIYRPPKIDDAEWWLQDISVLQMVTPFTLTRTVGVSPPIEKQNPLNGSCFAVVFHSAENSDKKPVESMLVKMSVKINEAEGECGDNFNPDRMVCSNSDNIAPTGAGLDYGHCLANSGGPLICDAHVVAIQTYIKPECTSRILYQRLEYWLPFLECTNITSCPDSQCGESCVAVDKDTEEKSIENVVSSEEHVHYHVQEDTNRTKRKEDEIVPKSTGHRFASEFLAIPIMLGIYLVI